jgi:ribonuclease VapC
VIAFDTSALLAIVFGEAEADDLLECLKRTPRVLIGASTVVEARMVVSGRLGPRGLALLDRLLGLPAFEVVPIDREVADAAFSAFLAFGRGSGHPARLNYGDVFSYAVARTRGVPLLWKGDDFGETDIEAALPRKAGPAG